MQESCNEYSDDANVHRILTMGDAVVATEPHHPIARLAVAAALVFAATALVGCGSDADDAAPDSSRGQTICAETEC